MSHVRRTLFQLTALGLAGFCPASAAAQETPATTPAPSAVCIAIVVPDVQGVEGSASDVGRALREIFVSYLTGPSIRVEALAARLASQASQEAKQKSCAHLLTATLTRKRSGGGGGLGRVLGHAGSSAVWGIPGGGIGGAVARGVATAGVQAVTELASSTKARDEMRLDYRVVSTDGQKPLVQREEKLKASVDGEDLVTPLVQKAAEAIAAAVVH
jgi:hypothetical protein